MYVGNLSFDATESDLRELFEPHGAVESANVATDRDTGRSRGFAFVEMSSNGEAETAITALNGREIHGRALIVNEARPKAPGFDGGRSGTHEGRRAHSGVNRKSRW